MQGHCQERKVADQANSEFEAPGAGRSPSWEAQQCQPHPWKELGVMEVITDSDPSGLDLQ